VGCFTLGYGVERDAEFFGAGDGGDGIEGAGVVVAIGE